jgi:hypothetical protein
MSEVLGGSVRPRSEAPRRLAVTVGAVALLLAGRQVHLPLLDDEAFSLFRGDSGVLALLSPLALGLAPFVAGFLLVELVAQVQPSLRPLRHGSARDRRVLTRAAWIAALALAAWQGFAHAVELQGVRGLHGDALVGAGVAPAVVVSAALVAGTLAVGCAAALVSRHGLGNGFAVFLAVGAVETLLRISRAMLRQPSGAWSDASLLVGLALAVVVPLVLAHAGRSDAVLPRLPFLTCGLAVIEAPWVLVSFTAKLAGSLSFEDPLFRARQANPWLGMLADLTLVTGLAVLLARLFCPPADVVGAFRRSAPQGGGDADADVRSALRAANRRSVALVVGVAAIPVAAALLETPVYVSTDALLALALVLAVGADLRAELEARARAPGLVSARALHRVYAVEPAMRALTAAGIPAFPRTRHLRMLFHFFAPWAPVEILVPPERAAEAEAICVRIEAPDAVARSGAME